MADSEVRIPSETLEAIARSLFKSTAEYGFRQIDYLRFVNLILDMSMKNGVTDAPVAPRTKAVADRSRTATSLPLQGESLQIRGYGALSDRDLFEKWMADERGRLFLLSRTTSKPLAIDELLRSDSNVLGVISVGSEVSIGLMAYLDVDQAQKKAELRKLIGEPQYRGRGYGKQATALWIEYGISGLGLKKIYLSTLETDVRNIRLNEELGFKVEGILRNECFFGGEYHDILRMALLAE